MDLDSILGGAKKKGGFSTEVNQQVNTPSPKTRMSKAEEINQENISGFARHGDCSDVEILNASYNYDGDTNPKQVEFSMERLSNLSNWTTGDIYVTCWISENRFSAENGWGGDNYFYVGEQFLGHLDEGYGFPDVKCLFDLPNDFDYDNARWHFVFTINELSEDGNKYIIDFRNSECHLADSDYSTIIEIIVDKLGIDSEDVRSESSFFSDFGADSLDAVELIMEIERTFDIQVADEDAEKIGTVGNLVDYLADVL